MPDQSKAEENETARSALLSIFRHVLSECSVARAFSRQVDYDRGILRIGEDLYPVSGSDPVVAIAFGKAAHPMAGTLARYIGGAVRGVVAGPDEPIFSTMVPGFEYVRGGHPLPDAGSLRAASAIQRTLSGLTERSLVIFLISGGGSAIVEKPVAGLSLDDLIATHRVLVHCGAPIASINAIRKHLSACKGGRLARLAAPAQQVSVLVSDVPDHALDALASGPTMPDSTTVEDCYRLAAEFDLLPQFPPAVAELFRQRALEETPKSGDPVFTNARWPVLLSNSSAWRVAAEQAAAAGFTVEVDNHCDDWDYAAAADYLLDRLRQLRRRAARACLISGGEVTVKVNLSQGRSGRGGRNQQFALYCAGRITGENIAVLSAGTDGIDGNSPAAGALVDSNTVARARQAGFDPARALERFDAYPLFESLDDAIVTGPTGNNIRDLRLLAAW